MTHSLPKVIKLFAMWQFFIIFVSFILTGANTNHCARGLGLENGQINDDQIM